MTITEVRFSGEARAEFCAFVAVVVGGVLAIKGLKLLRRRDDPRRLMLAMPDRERPDGVRVDIVHPICASYRRELEAAVFAAWARHCEAAAR